MDEMKRDVVSFISGVVSSVLHPSGFGGESHQLALVWLPPAQVNQNSASALIGVHCALPNPAQ